MAEGLIRAFVALPLADATRHALDPYLRACERLAPSYRWVPAANLHLTLRFLGRVDRAGLERLRAALAEVRTPPFWLRTGAVGTFGGRVIWLGLDEGEAEAGALAAAVDRACEEAGLGPADVPFRAHLTLARATKGARRAPSLPPPPDLDRWRADAFSLYQSRLGRPHATYVPLDRFSLGGNEQ